LWKRGFITKEDVRILVLSQLQDLGPRLVRPLFTFFWVLVVCKVYPFVKTKKRLI